MMSSVSLIDAENFLIWLLHVAAFWGQCYEQNEYEGCCISYLVSSFNLFPFNAVFYTDFDAEGTHSPVVIVSVTEGVAAFRAL